MRWGRMVGAALLTLGVLGCAANPRITEPGASLPSETDGAQGKATAATEQAQAPEVGARIESITARPEDDSTLVTIRGSHPLSYTSYDPDATTLVLELPDADPGSLEPVIEVGTPQLTRILVSKVESASGRTHARIELIGRASARTRIEPEESALNIFLEGTAPAGTAPQEAELQGSEAMEAAPSPVQLQTAGSVSAPAAMTAPTASTATMLNQVEVTGSDEAPVIMLKGDGSMRYHAFELNDPLRLVVDVQGVTNAVRAKRIPVASRPVVQVRVSQFSMQPEKVTRVVFDLSRRQGYEIRQEGAGLAVEFGEAKAATMDAGRMPAPVEAGTTGSLNAGSTPDQPVAPGQPMSGPAGSIVPDVASAPPRAAASMAPDVRPASVSLKDAGQDVVLFEHAEPRMDRGGRMQAGGGNPNMTTLPESAFSSRTIAGGRRSYRGEKISVAFRDADLREVMFFFADVMKMNVVLDPDVGGKVDIRLNQVPWDQAFQVILKNQGLDAIEEDTVVRIAKTSKLRQEASDLKSLKQAQEQSVDPVIFTRTLSYAKVNDAMQVLTQVKTERGRIVADIRTNTLVISDIPDKKQAYEGLLDALDTQTPQVIIEARIVEAIRSFERDIGINWAMATTRSPATGNPYPYEFPHRINFLADVNTAPMGFPSAGGIGLSFGNILDTITLDITLEAFEADGKVRILSSPKIATQNNQPATIEQGVQIPVVTTTATEVDVQYVPASLRMIVTPQITAEDTVIMKVKVENNQPSSTISVADVPGIVTESVDTQILVRTGSTAVIGGVYKLQESETETGIPGLRRIPFFGWLFKNRVNKKDSSELLVFLTPKIVKNI